MRNSIINNNKMCYVCGTRRCLHRHHILFGKNRKKADEDGLTVYLCYNHHEGQDGIHGKNGSFLDYQLKRLAEEKWLEYYQKSEDDFIKRYGKNYLWTKE